jgi:hypothetical protein
MKQFIAMNEVNVVDIFVEQEKDDGYLNRNELSNAFEHMGIASQGAEHEDRIDAFYLEFDRMKTMTIDMDQVINAFYLYANTTS